MTSVTPTDQQGPLTLEDRILKSKNLHIAVVCSPNMGHMFPCAKVAETMSEAGHQVTFVTIATEKGKSVCPKLFDGTNIKYVMHDVPECEEALLLTSGKMDPYSQIMFPKWEPHVLKTLEEIKPDLVVGDFMYRVGITCADQLGIPSVVNCGFALAALKEYGVFSLIDTNHAMSCCGCLCVCKGLMPAIMDGAN